MVTFCMTGDSLRSSIQTPNTDPPGWPAAPPVPPHPPDAPGPPKPGVVPRSLTPAVPPPPPPPPPAEPLLPPVPPLTDSGVGELPAPPEAPLVDVWLRPRLPTPGANTLVHAPLLNPPPAPPAPPSPDGEPDAPVTPFTASMFPIRRQRDELIEPPLPPAALQKDRPPAGTRGAPGSSGFSHVPCEPFAPAAAALEYGWPGAPPSISMVTRSSVNPEQPRSPDRSHRTPIA